MSEGLGLAGAKSSLNIGSATVIDDTTVSSYTSRRVSRVHVLVAGTTQGSVNDCLTIAAVAPANQVFAIPNAAGAYLIDFPMLSGIVVSPGAGQVVAVSYD